MTYILTGKRVILFNLIVCLICCVIKTVYGEEIIKNDEKSYRKSEDKSLNEGTSFRKLKIEGKITTGFHNIFEDLEKIRNAIPMDNNVKFPYEEIFFFENKPKNIESKTNAENTNDDTTKTLLNRLSNETPTPEDDTGALMYNKAVTMLNSYYSNKKQAYAMLLNASSMGHQKAKAEVAWGLLHGTHLPQNITTAKQIFQQLAEEGEAEGHTGMGFLHSVGLSVKASEARALLHYTIAALGGSHWSRLILGFKNWFGIAVTANCEKALEFYRSVASRVASQVEPNGGDVVHRIRLLDEAEDPGYQSGLIDSDLREYYEMMANKGEESAQVGLGQLYYRGARGFPKDYKKALMYFKRAATTGNAIASAFVGKIYLEGDQKVEVDLLNAYVNFKKAADQGNAIGQFGLGLMYLEGKYVEKDSKKALSYLSRSADQGWVESLLVLGTMYLQGTELKRDYRTARKYFIMASQIGHVLGYFNLAQMHSSGIGTMRSCTTAVELFKNVAERGKWGCYLMDAYKHYKNKRFREAFVIYAFLAEMGYEVAQSNAAFLLDSGLFSFEEESEVDRYLRAKIYWGRSAIQGNPLALIKLGDYYFYGLGTKVDYDTAATYYRIASEQYRNPQAMFNLGYMHEQGLGLRQDLHLAKRCYDRAAEISPDAEFPVLLALMKLYIIATIYSFKDADWTKLMALSSVSHYLGQFWDLYLAGFLVLLATYIIHFRVNRRDLLRDLMNFL